MVGLNRGLSYSYTDNSLFCIEIQKYLKLQGKLLTSAKGNKLILVYENALKKGKYHPGPQEHNDMPYR